MGEETFVTGDEPQKFKAAAETGLKTHSLARYWSSDYSTALANFMASEFQDYFGV